MVRALSLTSVVQALHARDIHMAETAIVRRDTCARFDSRPSLAHRAISYACASVHT